MWFNIFDWHTTFDHHLGSWTTTTQFIRSKHFVHVFVRKSFLIVISLSIDSFTNSPILPWPSTKCRPILSHRWHYVQPIPGFGQTYVNWSRVMLMVRRRRKRDWRRSNEIRARQWNHEKKNGNQSKSSSHGFHWFRFVIHILHLSSSDGFHWERIHTQISPIGYLTATIGTATMSNWTFFKNHERIDWNDFFCFGFLEDNNCPKQQNAYPPPALPSLTHGISQTATKKRFFFSYDTRSASS